MSRNLKTALLIGLAVLAGCDAQGPKFTNTDVTGAEWGRELRLTGHDGKPRTLADFRGKVVVARLRLHSLS